MLLDGEESQLIFIDHPHGEISVSVLCKQQQQQGGVYGRTKAGLFADRRLSSKATAVIKSFLQLQTKYNQTTSAMSKAGFAANSCHTQPFE